MSVTCVVTIVIFAAIGAATLPADGQAASPRQSAQGAHPKGRSAPEPAAIEAWIARFVAGDDTVVADLAKVGPQIYPGVEAACRAKKVAASSAARLAALASAIIDARLDLVATEAPGVRFRGQYASLEVLGDAGVAAAARQFLDEDLPVERRIRAAYVLTDIGNASLLPKLREVVDDYLSEDWQIRESGLLMAQFGDRSYVDSVIETNRADLDRELEAGNLPDAMAALTTLSEIYYRIGEYAASIQATEQRLTLLKDLETRIPAEHRQSVREEMRLLHYNLACAYALAGRFDESFAELDVFLQPPEGASQASIAADVEMVIHDGDLRTLRELPRFSEWLRDQSKKRSAEEHEPGAPPVDH